MVRSQAGAECLRTFKVVNSKECVIEPSHTVSSHISIHTVYMLAKFGKGRVVLKLYELANFGDFMGVNYAILLPTRTRIYERSKTQKKPARVLWAAYRQNLLVALYEHALRLRQFQVH